MRALRPSRHQRHPSSAVVDGDFSGRLVALQVIFALGFLIIGYRLFQLQLLQHGFYAALASDQHGIVRELFPERGEIYLTDPTADGGRFPAAVNKDLTLVYADPRLIENPVESSRALAPLLEVEEATLLAKLAKRDDPYEPLKRRVEPDRVEVVRALNLPGINFAAEPFRYYPDKDVAAHLTGFVGMNDAGERVGRYGVEGFWNRELTGTAGMLEADGDPLGRLIGSVGRTFRPAVDGVDLTLTIDRNIQFYACERLKQSVAKFGAAGGSVVVLNPKDGAVLALCGCPNYDPNDYSSVPDMRVYNNPATFSAYEPGSVFKPIVMAAALDAGKVTPQTSYEDTGAVSIGPHVIKNSDGKANGIQNMTQVLEKSLNTGMIFVAGRLGTPTLRQYVKDFGFGQPTGVEIDSEVSGNVSSLDKSGDIWGATASFGQGLTVTPLQLAAAYAALANGGQLYRPHIVAQIEAADGQVLRTEPQLVRQVISKRAAALASGMMVQVVENGHGKRAAVPGYWVAGKTGTAQIAASGGGYESDAFNGSFVGFAPVDNPAFVIAVRIEQPQEVQWAESTAAPLFGEIAAYLLQYLQIEPER